MRGGLVGEFRASDLSIVKAAKAINGTIAGVGYAAAAAPVVGLGLATGAALGTGYGTYLGAKKTAQGLNRTRKALGLGASAEEKAQAREEMKQYAQSAANFTGRMAKNAGNYALEKGSDLASAAINKAGLTNQANSASNALNSTKSVLANSTIGKAFSGFKNPFSKKPTDASIAAIQPTTVQPTTVQLPELTDSDVQGLFMDLYGDYSFDHRKNMDQKQYEDIYNELKSKFIENYGQYEFDHIKDHIRKFNTRDEFKKYYEDLKNGIVQPQSPPDQTQPNQTQTQTQTQTPTPTEQTPEQQTLTQPPMEQQTPTQTPINQTEQPLAIIPNQPLLLDMESPNKTYVILAIPITPDFSPDNTRPAKMLAVGPNTNIDVLTMTTNML